MRSSAVLLLVTACAGAALPTPPAALVAAPRSSAPVSGDPLPAAPVAARSVEPARDPRQGAHLVLVRHCGECHQGSHAGAPPPALAAFDLDRPEWAERFDARRFEVALARFSDKPPADRATFVAFRDAALTVP